MQDTNTTEDLAGSIFTLNMETARSFKTLELEVRSCFQVVIMSQSSEHNAITQVFHREFGDVFIACHHTNFRLWSSGL